MPEDSGKNNSSSLKMAPTGLAILALVGPSMIWAAEYIGSGEVIIATLGTIYNLGSDIDEESSTLIDKMRRAVWESGPKTGQPVFSVAVAMSIMVFFALCCQCGATLVTIRQEAGRWFYAAFVFVYMTVTAYLSSLAVYQLFSRVGS